MPERPDQDPPQDFASLFAAYEKEQASAQEKRGPERTRRGPAPGDKVTGTIVGFGEESAFVDLGGKSEGVVPLHELTDRDGARTHQVGDTVEGLVVAIGDDGIVLRLKGGAAGPGPAAAAELAAAHAAGLPVEGTVQAVIKGGVEVTVAGLRAFCPISQLDDRFVQDAAAFVGQRLTFRISRFEEGRGRGPNVVLSRRALLEEESRARAAEVLARLAPGQVLRGTVTSLASYGAFVDLGGVEGLLHVSELGHGRVAHPQEVLAEGQEVEVQVMKIEPAREGKDPRISLSRRPLLADPWKETAAKLKPGSRHRGRVVRLQDFGAFVELAPGVDGLLHLSELSAGRAIRHPREAVRVGDSIDVAVISVEEERRRISLTLAASAPEATAADAPAEPPGFGALGDFFDRGKKDG